jgi:uncharacterized phiE125 gp8 family phage protein
MKLERIVAPATLLLSLSEAKDQCRVDNDAEDGLISDYIAAATAYLDARDGVLGEALVTQTWRVTLATAPDGDFKLPLGPVQTVVQIRYVDPAGIEQTFAGAQYRLVSNVIELVAGASWPAVADRASAFWVDFVAGYGAAAAVPETIRHLARTMVAQMYDRRMPTGDGELSPVFKHLLAASRSDRGLF